MQRGKGRSEWLRGPEIVGHALPRLLLVSRQYPPSAEIGAARWEAFTRPLVAAGYGLDVIMSHPSELGRLDESRIAALPAQVRVFAAAAGEGIITRTLLHLSSLVQHRRLRSPGGHGDAPSEVLSGDSATGEVTVRDTARAMIATARQRSWIRSAIAAAEAIVSDKHCAVLCSGPPHEAYVVAASIARRFGLPLIVDFRDPWRSEVNRLVPLKSLTRDPLRASQEESVLAQAAAILVNTPAAGRVLTQRFPSCADRVHVLPNGSDLPVEARPPRVAPGPFRLVHTGTLYWGRDPRPFLKAVASVCARLELAPSDLELVFMGADAVINGRPLKEWAADAGLGAHFVQLPFGTREAAQQLLRTATMTVAFQGPSPTQIPAKIYEYASFNAWMLALCGVESATAEALEGSGAIISDLDDVRTIEQAICTSLTAFRAGELPAAVNADGRFSRERHSARLVALLAEIRAQGSPQVA